MKLYLLPLLVLCACAAPSSENADTDDTTVDTTAVAIDEEMGRANDSPDDDGSSTMDDTSAATSQGLHASKVSVLHHYTGVIGGKYKFLANLWYKGGDTLEGQYRYYTQKDFLMLRGKLNKSTNAFALEESYYDYKKQQSIVSGLFEGVKQGDTVKGKWFNKDRSKSFDFVLSTYEKAADGLEILDNSRKSEDQIVTDSIAIAYNGEIKQYITGFESSVYDFVDPVNMEDINFDGYLDILVIEFTGAKNTPYLYFVYDPDKKEFIKHDELTATSPTVDVQHNYLISEVSASAMVWISEKYIWQDGRFYLIESTEKNYEIEKTTVTKYKIVNGVAVEI